VENLRIVSCLTRPPPYPCFACVMLSCRALLACMNAPSGTKDLSVTLKKSYRNSKASKKEKKVPGGRKGAGDAEGTSRGKGRKEGSFSAKVSGSKIEQGGKAPSKATRSVSPQTSSLSVSSTESSRPLTDEERGALTADVQVEDMKLGTKDAETATAQDFWF
jgi:hypothetical protein